MTIKFTKPAEKEYKKLPVAIQKKADKALAFLLADIQHPHPALYSRKMDEDKFEARIDYHYRFTYEVNADVITIRTIGMHDEGLGKK